MEWWSGGVLRWWVSFRGWQRLHHDVVEPDEAGDFLVAFSFETEAAQGLVVGQLQGHGLVAIEQRAGLVPFHFQHEGMPGAGSDTAGGDV